MAVFIPAVASSVLMAAVGATDLAFASAYPGGAAALSLAFLLAMAPIGVASTSLVVRDKPKLLATAHLIILHILRRGTTAAVGSVIDASLMSL